jgi:hypothetical protein
MLWIGCCYNVTVYSLQAKNSAKRNIRPQSTKRRIKEYPLSNIQSVSKVNLMYIYKGEMED